MPTSSWACPGPADMPTKTWAWHPGPLPSLADQGTVRCPNRRGVGGVETPPTPSHPTIANGVRPSRRLRLGGRGRAPADAGQGLRVVLAGGVELEALRVVLAFDHDG